MTTYPFNEQKKKSLHQRWYWIVWTVQVCAALGSIVTPNDSLINDVLSFINLFLFTVLMIMLFLDFKISSKKHKKFMYEFDKEIEILRKPNLTSEDLDKLRMLREKRDEDS